ncbi:unnamed protein product [Rotaria sp. Silwood2]|nr:unnamed protein product [Rotaria sp. Silwood2]CAF4402021.1 unnamed protein product [Rotaria sp. Silwood2]
MVLINKTSLTYCILYYRTIEPTTHTQPSIIRINNDDDEDDELSSSSENEDFVLIKSEIPPSPIENNVSLLLMPDLDHLSLTDDVPTMTAMNVDKSTSDLENDDEQDNE